MPTGFAKCKGLILDMRGYPSRLSAKPIAHLSSEQVWSARWNVPVLRKPFLADVAWDTTGRWPIQPRSPHITASVVFLTNARAVSYAETWMGIIEAYHLGTIVGEPTAGTNGNVASIMLPGGYSMSYTGMKVSTSMVGLLLCAPRSTQAHVVLNVVDRQLDICVVTVRLVPARFST